MHTHQSLKKNTDIFHPQSEDNVWNEMGDMHGYKEWAMTWGMGYDAIASTIRSRRRKSPTVNLLFFLLNITSCICLDHMVEQWIQESDGTLLYFILLFYILQGSRFYFIQNIPDYLKVLPRSKKNILHVTVQTILAPKGRHQRHSKIAGVQNMKKIVYLNIILKCCIYLNI